YLEEKQFFQSGNNGKQHYDGIKFKTESKYEDGKEKGKGSEITTKS
ncbi:17921_t:CDS:2, partial [Acaulospora morrowiae]